MNRLLTMCLLLVLGQSLRALEPGGADGTLRRLEYHLRCGVQAGRSGTWELRWGRDSLDYDYAAISYPGVDGIDPQGNVMVTLTGGSCRGGVLTERNRRTLHTAEGRAGQWDSGVSLRLHVGDKATVVAAGGESAKAEIAYDHRPDSIRWWRSVAGEGVIVYADTCSSSVAEPPRYMAPDNLPDVTYWTYYDRDTDPLRSRLGGRYELASVTAPDGTVTLVYLAGATEYAADWQPGRVKAVMSPTRIPGVYDLRWYSPDGTALSADTGATVDDNFLTLQFLRHKATVRYRRR